MVDGPFNAAAGKRPVRNTSAGCQSELERIIRENSGPDWPAGGSAKGYQQGAPSSWCYEKHLLILPLVMQANGARLITSTILRRKLGKEKRRRHKVGNGVKTRIALIPGMGTAESQKSRKRCRAQPTEISTVPSERIIEQF